MVSCEDLPVKLGDSEVGVQNSLWFGKMVSWASEIDVSVAPVLFFLVIFLASHLFLHRKKVHQAAGEALSISDGDVQNTCVGDGSVRSCDNSDAFGAFVVHCNDCQLHCSDEETKSLLFACNPRAVASGTIPDPLGSIVNVRAFELDPTNHKIFLSHSGAQKNFVEQLCVDLEACGYFFPFFDQRHHSLPKGKDFAPLIKEAARMCHVAVIVLSEEFLSSKWPMIELAEFHVAKHDGNERMNMLPLFYKLSVGDLDEQSIEDRWMPKWNELASKDKRKRIDVTQWAAAVRYLRGVNGLRFGQHTSSEVCYREEIVESIWKLSPGDLLYGSAQEMVGYHRIIPRVPSRFVGSTRVGASVLGLYGTSGLGKTTLAKALCDYSAREFMGRVCHVELGATTRMKRQELMLKTLCGIEEGVLNRFIDDRQGLKLMRIFMNREPVFLVIDNVTNDVSSREEAHEYLMVGFHPKSKIVITARSKEVLQDLLPGVRFCMSIPRLNEEEAGRIFLKSAAPMMSFSSLTNEERRIVGLCIRECLIEEGKEECLDDVENPHKVLNVCRSYTAYHPLALKALGDFLYRSSSNTKMLYWKDSLEEDEGWRRDVFQDTRIRSIIWLQFSTLRSTEQLLFLDIALYTVQPPCWLDDDMVLEGDFEVWVGWLSALHGESASVIKRRLRELKRSGVVDWDDESSLDFEFRVHLPYKEFAVWYVTQHGVTGFKNAWGVFQPYGTSLESHHQRSKHISNLVRLRVFDSTRSNIWTPLPNRILELQNLVLLQLYRCTNLRELSLEGLDSLCHLELRGHSNLVKVTMTRSSVSKEDGGIFQSLQYVLLEDLESLTHMPDFRLCSSLHFVRVYCCPKVSNFKGVECPHLRELVLMGLARHQLGRPPNFGSVQCLKRLSIYFNNKDIGISDAMVNRFYLYGLKRRRHVEGGVDEGPEDSDEFSAHFDADQNDVVRVKTTIINMHLENHFGKEGLSIVQKVLTHAFEKECCESPHSDWLWLEWSFNEDDKEVLELSGLSGISRVIVWQFKDPEEYDD